jgi:exonuclease SbcD
VGGFTFIHAADLHLDSPLLNLERYDGAPAEKFRGATREAFDNLVRLAIGECVRFVVVAGDLFDGDCKDFNTPLHLRRKLDELGRAGIRTFVVLGNHDAQSRMKKGLALRLPEAVRILSAEAPETVELEDIGVAIHGQSFENPREKTDLSARYPAPRAGLVNIGLLHTNCGGQEGHDAYAPSTVEKLTACGYEYWALGHVHNRAVLRAGGPWIVYPGNTQGRHVGERGAKGCTLVRLDGGAVTRVEHRDLDAVRWAELNVDASACEEPSDVVGLAAAAIEDALAKSGGRPLAVRVVVSGTTPLAAEMSSFRAHWADEIRRMTIEAHADDVWVEKVKVDVREPDAARRAAADTPSGLAAELAAFEPAPAEMARALEEIRGLLQKIPRDPRAESVDADVETPARLAELVDEAKRLAIARLQGEAGGA